MSFFKQKKLRILGASIIFILLILPGITLAQQTIKSIYQKMVAPETVEQNQLQDLGDPIITDTATTIEQGLNNEIKTGSNVKVGVQALYGNRLAYVDDNTQELLCFNLKNKQSISISKSANEKEQLVIFKDKLAWTESNEVWAYDFTDGSIVKVSEHGDWPDIYDDILVYRGESQRGIKMYNFKTKQTINISEKSDGWYTAPSIWKNIVTWASDSSGNLNVYYDDVKKNSITNVTNFTEDRYLGNPLATKNSIVYSLVDASGGKQLIEYDLKNGGNKTIPDLPTGIFHIAVDKYNGGNINYYRTNDEIVTIDLDSKQFKEYAPLDNKVMYGGVIIGTEKGGANKFEVQRNQ